MGQKGEPPPKLSVRGSMAFLLAGALLGWLLVGAVGYSAYIAGGQLVELLDNHLVAQPDGQPRSRLGNVAPAAGGSSDD